MESQELSGDIGLPDEAQKMYERLFAWFKLKQHAAELAIQERGERTALIDYYFPPDKRKEGTNTFELPGGYRLQAVLPIDRKVDQVGVEALKAMRVGDLPSDMRQSLCLASGEHAEDMLVLAALRLSIDGLLKYEPELKVRDYRTLTREQAMFFDRCLTIKPGSAQLKVEQPSKKGATGQSPAALEKANGSQEG